jgi:zinc/manganese transport system substrate-binding protein/manganese/iron transport system substrate-binding protein
MGLNGFWARGFGVGALMVLMAAGPVAGAETAKKIKVLTTVAPITNIVRNVAGPHVDLHGLIPEGADSHTFEPVPSDVKYIAQADLIILNGLHLETPTMGLVAANKKKTALVVQLADQTISRKEWVFDFSFPADKGDPNPHLWLNVAHAMKYVELVREALVKVDPANKAAYDANATAYLAKLKQLDDDHDDEDHSAQESQARHVPRLVGVLLSALRLHRHWRGPAVGLRPAHAPGHGGVD